MGKKLEDGTVISKVAYEVSISKLSVAKKEEIEDEENTQEGIEVN